MNFPEINFLVLLPVIILGVAGMVIMLADSFVGRAAKVSLGWLGVAGIGAALAGLVPMAANRGEWYNGTWWVDDYALFFHAVLLLIGGLTILNSMEYLRREQAPASEFVILVLFATAGALLMAGAGELMLIFIGLEALSISTYVLAGYRRGDLKSNESALKYFLLGSFASAFFLYGVALIFGATGTTNLRGIAAAVAGGGADAGLVSTAAALMLIALGFKVALVPFHAWTPDVYEGAPASVTGFMSVGPKAAGFAVFFRIFLTAFPAIEERWIWIIGAVALLTMVLGNVVAVAQENIKRMLAYSSIAHAGYVALAFAAGSEEGVTAAMFYLLAYAVMSLGAFAIVTLLGREHDRFAKVEDYAGLAARRPGLAALLSLFLLSLAGIPGTAGFAGKFFIFRAAVESGLIGLTIVGVLTTVVSFYYYLYVIVQMYMKEPREGFDAVSAAPDLKVSLAIAAFLTLYLGVFPSRVLDWASVSAISALASLN